MQKITVDLLRLAFSGAVVCAVVGAVDLEGLHDRGQFASAKSRVPAPIPVKAISIAVPRMCWATNDRIGAAATEEAQAESSAILQICASAAPALRRLGEPALNPQSLLAFAP